MEKFIKKIKQLLQLEYPFEVFYEDGSRSWVPQENKKPWGVFFGNGIISLKETDIMVPFAEAKVFQQDIAHKVATCGSKDFWENVAKQGVPALQKLNAFIEKLGGKRIEGFCRFSYHFQIILYVAFKPCYLCIMTQDIVLSLLSLFVA